MDSKDLTPLTGLEKELCCCGDPGQDNAPSTFHPADSCCTDAPGDDAPCCGPPHGPDDPRPAIPGYRLEPFAESFIPHPDQGRPPIPVVSTRLSMADRMGTLGARLGPSRMDYAVAPGLYALGSPGKDSPVLATCNYKLTFDTVRKGLAGVDAWLLVLDTKGVNVWCAAGKKTFSTEEMIRRISLSGLDRVVSHRKIVVPQLGATGVEARRVKRKSEFEVAFGPVRAEDIPRYLESGPDEEMRTVRFPFVERLVLIPVEFYGLRKVLPWTLAVLFVLSGVSPEVFSLSAAWWRGLWAAGATLAGIVSGAALAPLLLPWLPFRAFAAEGAVLGLPIGALYLALAGTSDWMAGLAGLLWITAASSWTCMNFTGSTPYASPSGVEYEMRRAIPAQALASLAAAALWVASPFLG